MKAEKSKPRVMAVASFGGHLVELSRIVALIEAEAEIAFVSTVAPKIAGMEGREYFQIEDCTRFTPVRFAKACWQMRKILRAKRPDALITTGAAPGLAAVCAAKMCRVRSLWIDSLANVERLSMSGRIASVVADRVLTQWEDLAGGRVEYHGDVFESFKM